MLHILFFLEIHAQKLFGFLAKGKVLEDLVQEAIDGEKYEYTSMYPVFKTKAEEEGRKAEAALFAMNGGAEEAHETAYKLAIDDLKKGIDIGDTKLKIFLCPVCGNIEIAENPSKCPVCGTPAARMIEVK